MSKPTPIVLILVGIGLGLFALRLVGIQTAATGRTIELEMSLPFPVSICCPKVPRHQNVALTRHYYRPHNLARAIFCIAEGLSMEEGFRAPIETVAMVIVAKVKVLEQQRSRAAGQSDGT